MSPKTHLTHFGYTIKIDTLTDEQYKQTIKDLTVHPIIPDQTPEDIEKSKFSLYRFTKNKTHIIVPRYYGISKFGKPTELIFNEEEIDVSFTKELRPHQKTVVDQAINYIKNFGGGLLSVPCGFGKCLAQGTPVMMYDGSIKTVESIVVGDLLMGDDSTPRKVLSLASGLEEMFKVYDKDSLNNESYTVNRSHILSLRYTGSDPLEINGTEYSFGQIVDISVDQYIKLGYYTKKLLKGYRVPLNFDKADQPIDRADQPIDKADQPIDKADQPIDKADQPIDKADQPIDKVDKQDELIDPYTCGSTITDTKDQMFNKFIIGTVEQRNLLLKGILSKYNEMINRDAILSEICDMDDFESISFSCFDNTLAEKIRFLCRSLGYVCYICKYDYGETYVDIVINPKDLNYTIELDSIDVGKYYGFEIDGNRRFVLGCLTVTHNTVCSLYIAKQLGLKTLVVVHQSFLLNQWIARIMEFFSIGMDRIGVIRQDKCRVEGKDIVVGMIQTLAKREYTNIFDKFGFVIYDEAHHVPCRYYSKALMKTGTRYTMALTATPYRGDGLIKIMYWFCGGTIYQEKMKMNKNVVTKIIHYRSTDKQRFALKKKWRLGKIKPNTIQMENNICEIESRNQAIVEMIQSLRTSQPERKILVLSQRKSHLVKLKKEVDRLIQLDVDSGKLDKDEIFSCFYIGDTKPIDRSDAEDRGDIIFATYHMAQEGLDIKHLNTLILASPKKDIVQAIGRIMRTILQAGDCRPLIIDIADDLAVFSNWAKIREKVYDKCQYLIEPYQMIDSTFVQLKEYREEKSNQIDQFVEELYNDIVEDEMAIQKMNMISMNIEKEKFNQPNVNHVKTVLDKLDEPNVQAVWDKWDEPNINQLQTVLDKLDKPNVNNVKTVLNKLDEPNVNNVKAVLNKLDKPNFQAVLNKNDLLKSVHLDIDKIEKDCKKTNCDLIKNLIKNHQLQPTLMDHVLHVDHLTEKDFDRVVIRKGGDVVDLDADIALGKCVDELNNFDLNNINHRMNQVRPKLDMNVSMFKKKSL